MYDSGECSAVIDQNISLGNEFWIEVGFIIYMVADGGAAEQIQDSLANALESNPEAVIRYAKKYKEILDLDTICNNDVLNYVSCLSTIDGNILEVAVEKIRKRIKALQGIAFQKTTGKDAGTCIERLRRQLQILERKMKNSGEEKWR
ncbi:hypothetical protein D6833_09950 [Candidatus Parcubacteria bacterium]|nr:MAG: hypothetical protein D6833_09950 [Candidatus Parcubacteria bacterium]